MKVGYVRVSAAEQNAARQEVLMEQFGVERIYVDIRNGFNHDEFEIHIAVQGKMVMERAGLNVPAHPSEED